MIIPDISMYTACDPGEVPPERQYIAVLRLPGKGQVHTFHHGANYDDTLAEAEALWARVTANVKTVDRRKTTDPMVRLQRALDTLAARFSEPSE